MNFGIGHTTSELIGCLDADSFVAPDALLEVVKLFEADEMRYLIWEVGEGILLQMKFFEIR